MKGYMASPGSRWSARSSTPGSSSSLSSRDGPGWQAGAFTRTKNRLLGSSVHDSQTPRGRKRNSSPGTSNRFGTIGRTLSKSRFGGDGSTNMLSCSQRDRPREDRKRTRQNSTHSQNSYD